MLAGRVKTALVSRSSQLVPKIAQTPGNRSTCRAATGLVLEAPQSTVITAPAWQFGVSENIGRKTEMEDRHVVLRESGKHSRYQASHPNIAAVFDGHGGQSSVEYATRHLAQEVASHPVILSTPDSDDEEDQAQLSSALKHIYNDVDSRMQQLAKMDPDGWPGGSTALLAFQRGNSLVTANAGDCRAVLCRNKEAHRITRDHTPNDAQEQFRIRSHGGQLRFKLNSGWRIMGTTCTLGVARGFGDFQFKTPRKLVTCDPDVVETPLSPEDSFVILASDGLWSVMTDEEAVEIASQSLAGCKAVDPQAAHLPSDAWADKAARSLVDTAVSRRVWDNITAMVILLNWHQHESSVTHYQPMAYSA